MSPPRNKTPKQNLLSLHKDDDCDCFNNSVEGKDKRCNYRDFPDGWSFVPDVGQAQARGEIFTPRWIVDKMIVDSGMLLEAAVYDRDYSNPEDKYLTARVIEPAVGTANYLSTILYHKLQYVKALSTDKQGETIEVSDLDRYHTNLLTAISSVYAYDIDAGNLATTKRRLLSFGKQKLSIPQTVDWWTSYIIGALNQDPDKKQKIGYSRVRPSIKNSLEQAQRHWYKFVKDGKGVIDNAYRETVGERMPNWLYEQCKEILDKNIKLFNGIKEGDTLDYEDDFFVPGYKHIYWTWWHFKYPYEQGWQPMVSEKEVSLQKMIKEYGEESSEGNGREN